MIEVVQIVTVVVLMLGLFWQQQRVFDRLGIRMDARFDKIDKRFDSFDKIDKRFDKLETKMDARFDEMDKHFDKLDACFDEMDECLTRIEVRLGIMPTPQPTAASTE